MNIIDFKHIFIEELKEARTSRLFLSSVVLLFLFILFSLFFSSVFLYIDYKINKPALGNCEDVAFSVKEGEGLKGIANRLEKEDLIDNDFYFTFFILSSGASKNLQAGDYIFDPCMSPRQIADKIIRGEVRENEVKVTIPEGFTLEQIEDRLSNFNFQFSIFNFQTKDYKNNYTFLRDAPEDASLEGYLFPDTYFFDRDSAVEDIVKKMLDNFNKKLNEDLREEIRRQNKTIYDTLIMASMIEKEVMSPEDKKLVSGILWKRLEIGMSLQVDATITYITGKKTTQITYQDLDIDSPYNTYKYKGLPLGPICNPGLESIKAAIYPEESDYWYYLSTPDGETIFSKTLQEHNEAKFKYLQK